MLFQVASSVLRVTAFESSTSNPLHKNRSWVSERDIVVKVHIELFFPDVGRVTYAEMLYRTNLIAYVPADHVTGLPSNVGTEAKMLSSEMSTTRFSSSECLR